MDNSYQKYTKDVIVIGFANIFGALSGIIFLPLVTKTLGAHDYGLWIQFQAVTSLVLSFVGLGLPYAINRFLPAERDKKVIREDFWSVTTVVLLVTVATCLVIFIMSSMIARTFFEGYTNIVVVSSLFVLVSSLNNIFLNFFRTFRQMMKYAVFTIVNTYGQIGIISYLILTEN